MPTVDYLLLFSGLPLLLGVCLTGFPFLMVTQFHGIEGKCVTLVDAIKTGVVQTSLAIARIFNGVAKAMVYLHKQQLLHNDIKGGNVILTADESIYRPVLIDFGKCRAVKNAKLYRLSTREQKIYQTKYRHIAPELVRGTHKQSFMSDIFSYGVMLSNVATGTCCSSQLRSLSLTCASTTIQHVDHQWILS